jgi:hypothetical protein
MDAVTLSTGGFASLSSTTIRPCKHRRWRPINSPTNVSKEVVKGEIRGTPLTIELWWWWVGWMSLLASRLYVSPSDWLFGASVAPACFHSYACTWCHLYSLTAMHGLFICSLRCSCVGGICRCHSLDFACRCVGGVCITCRRLVWWFVRRCAFLPWWKCTHYILLPSGKCCSGVLVLLWACKLWNVCDASLATLRTIMLSSLMETSLVSAISFRGEKFAYWIQSSI